MLYDHPVLRHMVRNCYPWRYQPILYQTIHVTAASIAFVLPFGAMISSNSFEYPVFCLRSDRMSYNSQRLDPICEEISPTDHQILCRGGTSSSLERLPSRLQLSKRESRNSRKQLEDLAYEISYLRAELQWHKESKQILLEFQERMFDVFQSMEDALSRASARIHESEHRYLKLWDHGSGDEASSRI